MMERLALAPAGTDAGPGNKKPFFSVAAEGRGSGSFAVDFHRRAWFHIPSHRNSCKIKRAMPSPG